MKLSGIRLKRRSSTWNKSKVKWISEAKGTKIKVKGIEVDLEK